VSTFSGAFDEVKVFSATKHNERNRLGDLVTEWITHHPVLIVAGAIVTQSSDSEYHCLTITLFLQTVARPWNGVL